MHIGRKSSCDALLRKNSFHLCFAMKKSKLLNISMNISVIYMILISFINAVNIYCDIDAYFHLFQLFIGFITITGVMLCHIVNEEKTRRTQAYMQIYTHGPIYSSSSYGKIEFIEDGSFRWNGFKLLVPSVIDAGTKSTGSAQVKYSLSKDLAASYDGVLTMKFDGMSCEVNFLYKLDGNALRLEDTTGATFNGSQLKSRGVSPVIIYLKKCQNNYQNNL